MKKFVVILLFLLLCSGCIQQNQPIACTADAKLCPDGSTVRRVPPDCEFAPCPDAINCSTFSVEDCPNPCVVCPACKECKSIRCLTEDFCESIGFDRQWYRDISPPKTL